MGRTKKVLTLEEIQKLQAHKQADVEKEYGEKLEPGIKLLEEQFENVQRPKKVADNRLNSPKMTTATRDEMANTVHDKVKWFYLGKKMGKVKPGAEGDQDLLNRMQTFWDMVEDSGEIPQKTDFYLLLGVDKTTADSWRRGEGCSRDRMEMMQMFDHLYSSVKDEIAGKGLINTIAYIWQSKQWQGYKEPKQEIDVNTNNPMLNFPDAKAVESKYSDLISQSEVDPKYLADIEQEE